MAENEANNLETLAGWVLPRCQPWRAMVIGIDGADGEGKSTLARYLAWKVGMTVLETDVFLITGTGDYRLRMDDLARAVRTRLDGLRPVIVEGLFLLRTLRALQISPEILIYVQRVPPNTSSSVTADLQGYRGSYEPLQRAHYLYRWTDIDLAV